MSAQPPPTPDGPTPWPLISASYPRPGHERNEDLIGSTPSAVWVLDGAGSHGMAPGCCGRDAYSYVHTLSDALAEILAQDGGLDLRQALSEAILAVRTDHHATCSNPSATTGPSAAVALARRRGDLLDYLVLGDCTVLVETRSGVVARTDRRLAAVAPDVRAAIRDHLQGGGAYSSPVYRSLLAQLVDAERTARNLPGGYWIAAEDPEAATHALMGTFPLGSGPEEVRRIALLSDGFARIVTTFRLHADWHQLLAALVSGGPDSCVVALRSAEGADPQGLRFPRTSPSDDASVIVCDLL
jgi:Protein phosphatase 2C